MKNTKPLAIATCHRLPMGTDDDRMLLDKLEQSHIECQVLPWDQDAVDWSRFSACLIRSTWDYSTRHQAFLRWIDAVAPVLPLINPASVLRWNTHKGYLLELERVGLPVVPSRFLDSGTELDLDALCTMGPHTTYFAKPVVAATSRGTLRFCPAIPEQRKKAVEHLRRHLATEAMIVQPYLSSVETLGEISLIYIDGHFSHAVQKRPQPGDYRVQDDFDGIHTAFAADPLLTRVGDLVIQHVDSHPYARVDLLKDPENQWRLIEVEMVEPVLFFELHPPAAQQLANAIQRILHAPPPSK